MIHLSWVLIQDSRELDSNFIRLGPQTYWDLLQDPRELDTDFVCLGPQTYWVLLCSRTKVILSTTSNRTQHIIYLCI